MIICTLYIYIYILKVLNGNPPYGNMNHIVELRSMVIGKFRDQSVLYVADAFSDDSYLNIYSSCDRNGRRDYITTVVSTQSNPGANHIYGICFDNDENV